MPYVKSANTGESRTRNYVDRFLCSWSSPDKTSRSIYDTIYGTTNQKVENNVLFPTVNREVFNRPRPQVISRASPLLSQINPDEELWCVKIDIANACKKLDILTRKILCLKYCFDYSDQKIAGISGVCTRTVANMIKKALISIVKTLDDNHSL